MPRQDLIPAGHAGSWHAVALHCHSRYSDGGKTVAELLEMARASCLDGLAISDHNNLRQTWDPDFTGEDPVLIRSEEWSSPRGPHAGIHGLTGRTLLDPVLAPEAMVAEAHRRGGLVVINHPGERFYSWGSHGVDGVHAMEVWNYLWGLDSGFGLQGALRAEPAGARRRGLRYHLLSTLATFWGKNSASLAHWHRLLRAGHRLTPIAASDYHNAPMRLASPVTWVFSDERGEGPWLEAIKAGHVALSRKVDGVLATLGTGATLPGATLPRGTTVQLAVHRGKGLRARLYGPSGMVATWRIDTDHWVQTYDHRGEGFLWARLDGWWPGGIQAIAAPVYFEGYELP